MAITITITSDSSTLLPSYQRQVSNDFVGHCSDGCLFELRSDPLEANDVAAKFPDRVAAMRKKIMAYVNLSPLKSFSVALLSIFFFVLFSGSE